MALEHFILYIIVFLYGIIIGSFLNVCNAKGGKCCHGGLPLYEL